MTPLARLRRLWRSSGGRGPETVDLASSGQQLLDETRSVRRELIATTDKLARYTESLNAEISRLKILADRVQDHG